MKIWILLIALLATTGFAQTNRRMAPAPDTLALELQALRNQLRIAQNQLEQKEAARWSARYTNNNVEQALSAELERMERDYVQASQRLLREKERLGSAQEATQSLIKQAEGAQRQRDMFLATLKESVDGSLQTIGSDHPVAYNTRFKYLQNAQNMLNQSKLDHAAQSYFNARQVRLQKTTQSAIEARDALWQSGEEIPVWHVRYGTLLNADVKRDLSNVQLLLRTGLLEGQTFVWRDDVSEQMKSALSTAVEKLLNSNEMVYLPMDILQNRALGAGFTAQETATLGARFKEWFDKGGLVMYPLVLIALSAFLLSIERMVYFWRKGSSGSKFTHKICDLLMEHKDNEALALCKKEGTSLGSILHAVLEDRSSSRAAAEKRIKEVMLREVPNLEKRMGVISALGASAPLMGLLGTVSGMITLFRVITEVGTNDARILAGGISEALTTTQAGLIIAIPVLLIHGFLTERLDTITANISSYSLSLLNTMWPEKGNKES
jgi:biopolymer transport protein ExbB